MGDQDSPDGLSPEDETRRMYNFGVDAVFADDPAQAVAIRAERKQNLLWALLAEQENERQYNLCPRLI